MGLCPCGVTGNQNRKERISLVPSIESRHQYRTRKKVQGINKRTQEEGIGVEPYESPEKERKGALIQKDQREKDRGVARMGGDNERMLKLNNTKNP